MGASPALALLLSATQSHGSSRLSKEKQTCCAQPGMEKASPPILPKSFPTMLTTGQPRLQLCRRGAGTCPKGPEPSAGCTTNEDPNIAHRWRDF